MATIQVEETTKVKKTVEVLFPLYVQSGDVFDNGGWYETVARVEQDGTVFEITKRGGRRDEGVAFEVEIKKTGDFSSYVLPGYFRQTDAKAFFKALHELREYVARFPVSA